MACPRCSTNKIMIIHDVVSGKSVCLSCGCTFCCYSIFSGEFEVKEKTDD